MLETGMMLLSFQTAEAAETALYLIKQCLSGTDAWENSMDCHDNKITVPEGTVITIRNYRGLPEKISMLMAEKMPEAEIQGLTDYYSEAGEIHHQFTLHNGELFVYKTQYEYLSDTTKEETYKGIRSASGITLVQEMLAFTEQESIQCNHCKEFFCISSASLLSRCPYCGDVQLREKQQEDSSDSDTDQNQTYPWMTYDYEIPLGVTFSTLPVSEGADWVQNCEKDETFGLNPVWFQNYEHYTAARNLCRACGGWYTYQEPKERYLYISCYRDAYLSRKGEPMWYYDPDKNSFNWIAALRENNPDYIGCFYQVENLWELFRLLSQRSFLEKADCFEWFVGFFGETLKYDFRHGLLNSYIPFKDQATELILYHRPEQIRMLKEMYQPGSYELSNLSYAAAGLVRMGRKEEGMALFEDLFQMSLIPEVSVDERKGIILAFLERMGLGYDNESFIDDLTAATIEKQLTHFSDRSFAIKVKLVMKK